MNPYKKLSLQEQVLTAFLYSFGYGIVLLIGAASALQLAN